MERVQKNPDTSHFQKTVSEDADMALTATDLGRIVTISKSNNNQNKKKVGCRKEICRDSKGMSSNKNRESSKRECKNSSEVDAEGKTDETRPEGGSGVLGGRVDSENPNCISNTEQPPQVNTQKKRAPRTAQIRRTFKIQRGGKHIRQMSKRKKTPSLDIQSNSFKMVNLICIRTPYIII
jgi:shugoshin-like 2